ncbi:MAG: UbiA family prenyltransferase [Bacteroidota bacterium]
MSSTVDTIKLLRFPFSLLLMPVFLFGISQTEQPNWVHTVVIFLVMHMLVYPASNGYNSFMDEDKGPIGGLENPPKPSRALFYITIVFDVIAVMAALFVGLKLALMILIYILVSRAYSNKHIRLKKYALISYLVVMFFQGSLVFAIAQEAAGDLALITNFYAVQAAFFTIGGIYPLTQIYQHDEDAKRGDYTISLKLGVKGTFKLSAVMFFIASALTFMHFYAIDDLVGFYLYLLFLSPVAAYFTWWMKNASKAPQLANHKFTMLMCIIAAACMNLYYLLLNLLNHF